MVQAFQAGLDGLCLTAMNREALIKALELVMLGETFIASALALSLWDEASRQRQARPDGAVVVDPAAAAIAGKLSGRETQILSHLTLGASNKHIARELGVAEATVKVHVKAILRKVKAANRTQAAMWAQQHMNLAANDGVMVLLISMTTSTRAGAGPITNRAGRASLQPRLRLFTRGTCCSELSSINKTCRSVGFPTDGVPPNQDSLVELNKSLGALRHRQPNCQASPLGGAGMAAHVRGVMKSKKPKRAPGTRRDLTRLERQLAAVDAQIARLEKDPRLGLAERDHFLLWKRPSLFMTERPAVVH